jgi:eukaryotic-like serine/threonine-protein kinase
VRGQAAGHRSDVFAFGVILYEMLAGKRAFQKQTSAETMSAILNEDPVPISQLATGIAPGLHRIVDRCLEKNPEQRFQSASDLAFALETLSDSGSSPLSPIAEAKSRTHRTSHWAWIVAITAIGTACIAAALALVATPARCSTSYGNKPTHE